MLMILFVGQVERFVRERGAFQEVDYRAMFGGQTNGTAEIHDAARIVEFVSRAFYTACSGRPGPVVLSLPKDMLEQLVVLFRPAPPFHPVETSPGVEEMDRLAALIEAAARPIFIAGGTRWDEEAKQALQDFAQAFEMPVATSYRRAPLFDALHPGLRRRSRSWRQLKTGSACEGQRPRRCRRWPARRS